MRHKTIKISVSKPTLKSRCVCEKLRKILFGPREKITILIADNSLELPSNTDIPEEVSHEAL